MKRDFLRGTLIFLTFSPIVMLLFFGCTKNEPTTEITPDTTIEDVDGNSYHTVTIGTQTWLVENLKTTKYRNGDPIPNLQSDNQWATTSDGAYSDYANNPALSTDRGKLYNWFAVNDARNIAPAGYHVPNAEEWEELVQYLGGEAIAGGKLKEAGLGHWADPNTGATNSSGFTALPTGFRSRDGSFSGLSGFGYYWSASENYQQTSAWYFGMNMDWAGIEKAIEFEKTGHAVRCIKD